jgi:hypothetical protein
MTGLIWFVQIVHYPIFDTIPHDIFTQFARRHCNLTGLVVGPPMIGEAISALLLAVTWQGTGKMLVWLNFALVVAIWLCTLLFSIPSHSRFCSSGHSESTLAYLLSTNWLRTVFWTIRALLSGWLLYLVKVR